MAATSAVADPPGKRHGRHRAPGLLDVIRKSLRGARTQILLISPYFVPGRRGTRELVRLARRGVRISVLTNSLAATDVLAVHGRYERCRRPAGQAARPASRPRPARRHPQEPARRPHADPADLALFRPRAARHARARPPRPPRRADLGPDQLAGRHRRAGGAWPLRALSPTRRASGTAGIAPPACSTSSARACAAPARRSC